MAICKCLIWRDKGNNPDGTKRFDQRVCAKKVVTFYEVTFSSGRFGNVKNIPSLIVVGFCKEHGPEFASVKRWNRSEQHEHMPSWQKGGYNAAVYRLPGVVDVVTLVPEPKQNPERLRIKSQFKDQLLRTMRQSNAKLLTIEDWEDVCRDAIEYWTVESVMEA